MRIYHISTETGIHKFRSPHQNKKLVTESFKRVYTRKHGHEPLFTEFLSEGLLNRMMQGAKNIGNRAMGKYDKVLDANVQDKMKSGLAAAQKTLKNITQIINEFAAYKEKFETVFKEMENNAQLKNIFNSIEMKSNGKVASFPEYLMTKLRSADQMKEIAQDAEYQFKNIVALFKKDPAECVRQYGTEEEKKGLDSHQHAKENADLKQQNKELQNKLNASEKDLENYKKSAAKIYGELQDKMDETDASNAKIIKKYAQKLEKAYRVISAVEKGKKVSDLKLQSALDTISSLEKQVNKVDGESSTPVSPDEASETEKSVSKENQAPKSNPIKKKKAGKKAILKKKVADNKPINNNGKIINTTGSNKQKEMDKEADRMNKAWQEEETPVKKEKKSNGSFTPNTQPWF